MYDNAHAVAAPTLSSQLKLLSQFAKQAAHTDQTPSCLHLRQDPVLRLSSAWGLRASDRTYDIQDLATVSALAIRALLNSFVGSRSKTPRTGETTGLLNMRGLDFGWSC